MKETKKQKNLVKKHDEGKVKHFGVLQNGQHRLVCVIPSKKS